METATAHISRRCRPFVASAIVVSALFVSISACACTEAAIVQFSQTRTVAHRHDVRPGYGWPVKPFNRQHPVRRILTIRATGTTTPRASTSASISPLRPGLPSMRSKPARSTSKAAARRSR